MKKIGIIADNLIGANDTGVQFSKHGLATTVVLELNKLKRFKNTVKVISVNTDTRLLTADQAYEHVSEVTKLLKENGCSHFYKKIDSTLRGNPGVEIKAVMDKLGLVTSIIVPAFSANNRIVENGYLLIDQGGDGNNTSFPVCHVPTMLEKEVNETVALINISFVRQGMFSLQQKILNLKDAGAKFIVVDAVTEDDLYIISKALKLFVNDSVIAGSAGLGAYMPIVLNLMDDKAFKFNNKECSVLVLAGTYNQVTADQINELKKSLNIEVVEFSTDILRTGNINEEIKKVTLKAEEILKRKKATLIAVDTLLKDRQALEGYKISENVRLYGKQIADSLGLIAKELIMKGLVTDLVISGGGTLTQATKVMGACGITLEKELLPGIPSGRLKGGDCDGIHIVTKAGGFGTEDSLVKIVRYLEKGNIYAIYD
ncbi:four-carbon acid sugar kinase family protein [Desulfitibacter alkalitolerans]|uniref:four-carbon acid sugar kinase family protein n=1 Tax=Desulfitibacter alkalitolerans TaxID=264641 RepID=UPI000489EBBB|nr:four-carbon acid sugar kinase family protein [Desulfitibacter alkalitolerans]